MSNRIDVHGLFENALAGWRSEGGESASSNNKKAARGRAKEPAALAVDALFRANCGLGGRPSAENARAPWR